MAFPSSPSNGQTYTIGGVTYTYNSTAGAWQIQTYNNIDAATALAQIKTIDGAGSGLDADLLDGVSSSQFMRSDIQTTANNTILLGNQSYPSQGTALSTFSGYSLRFDNTYAPSGGTSPGAKVVMHDNSAGNWLGGFGIRDNIVEYYSGGNHDFYVDTYRTTLGTLGVRIAEGSGTDRLQVNGDVKLNNGKVKVVADNSNYASGMTVYNSGSTGYLSYRVTTDQNAKGWGWELANNQATDANGTATPWLRLDYNGKYMTIVSTTVAALPSTAPAGSLAYVTDDGGNLYYKNANAWKSYTAPLGSSSNPAPSATAILASGDSTGDGYYYIKPHTSSAVYYVYCDMTTDGGGWMLMINARPGNGGQYYNNNDYGLSTINGVAGVPEYNKSTTSMFGTTKITDFLKMAGFKYGRMTPGPGISITAPYTGLYQRIGTSTSYSWMGTGFDCSNRGTIASQNPWVLTQYQNWSDCAAGSSGRTGGYTGSNHYYPTTYDNGWQNFWKGDQDGLRFSSTFNGENYTSIGQNTSPGYWWIKSDQ